MLSIDLKKILLYNKSRRYGDLSARKKGIYVGRINCNNSSFSSNNYYNSCKYGGFKK